MREPFAVLAQYFSAAKTGDVEKVLPLYDEKSQTFIRALPAEQIKRSLEIMAAHEFCEIYLIIDRDPVLFLYGFATISAERTLTQFRLIRVGEEYRMAAGESPVSVKYQQHLMTVLSEQGFSALKKSAN